MDQKAMMKSKKSFEVSNLLERYNNLKLPYQMVLFFTPLTIITFAVFLGLISFVPGGFHAPGFYDAIALNKLLEKGVVADKITIMKNVDTIVAAINSGKSATDFKSTDFSPFFTIINEEGEMIVHPVFSGLNVKERAPYIYNEIVKGTVGGTWVNYPVRGKLKHVYVKKTKSNHFVTSGYFKQSSSPPNNADK